MSARHFFALFHSSLSLSLSLYVCVFYNAGGSFGDRYTAIVIAPLSEIPSKITANRGFTSPSGSEGKEMTGWSNRMTSPSNVLSLSALYAPR